MPVVVDVETGGFNSVDGRATRNRGRILVYVDDRRQSLRRGETIAATTSCHSKMPTWIRLRSRLTASTRIIRCDPPIPERDALQRVFRDVRAELREWECNRAILVGHNAHFDLGFVNAAIERTGIKRNPFHTFSVLDTASLCGVAFGQTVLARAARAAGLAFDPDAAHSAAYDAEITADLFCEIVNRFRPIYAGSLDTAGAPPAR